MEHKYAEWTKIYSVEYCLGTMKIFVTKHINGDYNSAVLYYEHIIGDWSENSSMQYEYKLEQFLGVSEREAFDECEKWIKKHLEGHGNYKITLERANLTTF